MFRFSEEEPTVCGGEHEKVPLTLGTRNRVHTTCRVWMNEDAREVVEKGIKQCLRLCGDRESGRGSGEPWFAIARLFFMMVRAHLGMDVHDDVPRSNRKDMLMVAPVRSCGGG